MSDTSRICRSLFDEVESVEHMIMGCPIFNELMDSLITALFQIMRRSNKALENIRTQVTWLLSDIKDCVTLFVEEIFLLVLFKFHKGTTVNA